MSKEIKWDARYKGDGWAGRVLERIFINRKLSIFGPLGVAAAIVLLFMIFGQTPDKMLLLQKTLIASVFMYFGTLLVLGFQVFHSMYSPRFMDGSILFLTSFFGIASVFTLAADLLHPNDGFDPGHAVPFVMLSAIALIQNRRK